MTSEFEGGIAYNDEVVKALFEEFDKSLVRQVPGNNRRPALDYIDLPPIVKRITDAVGSNWEVHFELFSNDPPAVKCTLTIAGQVREGIGQGAGTDEVWKSCETDAFKRAARYHGIALSMWEKSPHPQQQGQPAAHGPQGDAWKSKPISDPQAKTIFGIAADFGIDDDEIRANILNRYKVPIEKLTMGQASEFIEILKAPKKAEQEQAAAAQPARPAPPATQRNGDGAMLANDVMRKSILGAGRTSYKWTDAETIAKVEAEYKKPFNELLKTEATDCLRRIGQKTF